MIDDDDNDDNDGYLILLIMVLSVFLSTDTMGRGNLPIEHGVLRKVPH